VILELRDVTAGYGAITVLQGLSLGLGDAEIVAVLGANGSGKSTALKTAAGLTRVSAGAVVLEGRDVTAWPAHRRAAAGLGYVPQTGNVFGDLSVADNLRMGAWLHPRRWEAEADRALDLFPALRDRRRAEARHLSGGERRMLSLAMTLLLRPRLLLLDEPSSDLAPALVTEVFDAIGRMHAEARLPVLLVEQNVAVALGRASRAVVLVRGRVAHDGPAAGLGPDRLQRLFLDGGAAA
jgi:ABC-type branched-subunit amino acid transport system ATPase component